MRKLIQRGCIFFASIIFALAVGVVSANDGGNKVCYTETKTNEVCYVDESTGEKICVSEEYAYKICRTIDGKG